MALNMSKMLIFLANILETRSEPVWLLQGDFIMFNLFNKFLIISYVLDTTLQFSTFMGGMPTTRTDS